MQLLQDAAICAQYLMTTHSSGISYNTWERNSCMSFRAWPLGAPLRKWKPTKSNAVCRVLNQPSRPGFSHYVMSVAAAHSVQFPGKETPNCHRFLHAGGWSMAPHSGRCTSLARAQFDTQAAISQPAPDDQLFSCFWPASLWFRDHNTTST